MPGKVKWTRLGLISLAMLCALQTGCLSFVHPVDPLPAEEIKAELDIPAACKNGVYIFFLHGIDPLDLGNLAGLHDYIQSVGFIKTYYGLPFHAFHYENEIRKIRKREPNARIVLIGFSYGAGLVRDITCGLRKYGIDIDLLVYIDGVEYDHRPLHRPANAHKVVNILSYDRSDNKNLSEGENMRYNDVWHFGTVTHPQTVRMLVHELGEVALKVPVITPMPAPIPNVIVPPAELLPAPTPVTKRGEWDFLKPDSHTNGISGLKPVSEAGATRPAWFHDK